MKRNSQMNRKMMSNSNLKPVCSVIDMIRMLGLSRARFYQLVDKGIFPPPIYSIDTHRAMYDLTLQQACLTVRETNIGYNGQYCLFYSPRKQKSESVNEKSSRPPKINNPLHEEFAQTLNRMGLSVDAVKVGSAIEKLYADGIEDKQHGVIIRELFRYFRGQS
jgi:hypothetical protein